MQYSWIWTRQNASRDVAVSEHEQVPASMNERKYKSRWAQMSADGWCGVAKEKMGSQMADSALIQLMHRASIAFTANFESSVVGGIMNRVEEC